MKGTEHAASLLAEKPPAGAASRYIDYLPPLQSLKLQVLGWGVALGLLLVLPFMFSGALGLSVLMQICIAITFALAYNMLLGGTGLLSFGHAVYFGVGAYATAHLLNHFGSSMPVILAPLVGAAAALVTGAVFALFTVRSGKTIYAMVSLAVGQLAFATATIMTSWSGGDEGIGLDPAKASGWGIDFGSPLAIYFLIAGWAWLAALAMFALTHSPLGRLMNATRDNPERMEFVGFNPVVIRGLALTLSAGFAGVAGALYALGFQTVTLDTLALSQSTAGLLQVYIGGYTTFFGPMIGAILVTIVSVNLSSLTDAWPLYLGVFFVVVIMFMRFGLSGSSVSAWRRWRAVIRSQGPGALVKQIWPRLAAGVVCVLGFVACVEMMQSLSQNRGMPVPVFGPQDPSLALDPHNTLHWIFAIAMLCGGMAGLEIARRSAAAGETSKNRK